MKDLCWRECVSKQDLINIFNEGKANRTTHSTKMNDSSSRSHLIFSVMVVASIKGKQISVGKLNLVDLAGSERSGKTDSNEDRFEEAKGINSSLLKLGKVMKELSDLKENKG